MDDRRKVLVLAALLVVATGLGIAVTYNVPVKSGSTFQTDSHLNITIGLDTSIQSGNPFSSSDRVDLRQIGFRGRDTDATVDAFNATTSGHKWTNVSSITTNNANANLTVIRPEAKADPITVSGTVDDLRVANETDYSESGYAEVVASAGGSWTLTVHNTGLSQGRGVVIEEAASGDVLDASSVDANGDVTFNELSSLPTTRLNIRKGPAVLKVFEAENPSTKVTGVDLQVRVFGGDTVVERTVSNGELDLTGVPKDERLTVSVDEETTNEYVFRRTIIPSVTQQTEIYLLNSSNTNVANVRFILEDRTGSFPPELTELFVQRPITKDFDGDGTNETKYQSVAGDTFGAAAEFPTVLANEERYRLRVVNRDGDSRILGGYTSAQDDVAEVRIGEVGIQIPDKRGYAVDMRTFRTDNDNDGTKEQFVRVVYDDQGDRTESLDYNVTKPKKNSTVTSVSVSGPLGEHVNTIKVNDSVENTTYQLNWEASREQPGGTDETVSGIAFAGKVPPFAQKFPIDQFWLRLIGIVGIVATAGLVVIVDPALGAVAATITATIMTLIGVVAIPMAAIGLAAAISALAVFGRST